jgi:hypothetical protein
MKFLDAPLTKEQLTEFFKISPPRKASFGAPA